MKYIKRQILLRVSVKASILNTCT